MENNLVYINKLALILTIIGGINWGLIGLFNFNLVEAIFGSLPILATIVYVLVGIAACYTLYAYINK